MTPARLALCIAAPVVFGLVAAVTAYVEALSADSRNTIRRTSKESAR